MITERNDDNRSSRVDFAGLLCSFHDLYNPSCRNYVCDSTLYPFKFDEKKIVNIFLKPIIIISYVFNYTFLYFIKIVNKNNF